MVGTVLGKYRVVEKLGSGGMADVFKGVQIGLDREVAIKVLPAALAQDREMVKRFRRESQSTAKLSHPNIITIYDSGQQDGTYFYVMEFLKSESLEDLLERQRPIALPRAIKVAQDVLKALVYCHEKGVCHGDLRPAHIKFDMRENAVVTDFAVEADAPAADPGADLCAAAAMLGQMLSGADLPDDVAAWLAKRHQTAKEMLADLKKIELRLKAKQHLSKPTQVSRAPSSAQDSQAEPSEVLDAPPAREALAHGLAAMAGVFVAGVAIAVWMFWPAPAREVPGALVVASPSPSPPAPRIQVSHVDVTPFSTGVTINWSTNVKAIASVRYGPTAAFGQERSSAELRPDTEHSVTITDLTTATRYHFQIVATDLSGQQARSPDGTTFTTLAEPTGAASLIGLTRSYVDKLSRMTPDERQKLRDAIRKFTDVEEPLSAADKAALVAKKTEPKNGEEFASRLRLARRWMVDLALAHKPDDRWVPLPQRLEKLYFANPFGAAQKLDAWLAEMSAAEKK